MNQTLRAVFSLATNTSSEHTLLFSVLLDKRELCCLICEMVNIFLWAVKGQGVLFTGLNCESYQRG